MFGCRMSAGDEAEKWRGVVFAGDEAEGSRGVVFAGNEAEGWRGLVCRERGVVGAGA